MKVEYWRDQVASISVGPAGVMFALALLGRAQPNCARVHDNLERAVVNAALLREPDELDVVDGCAGSLLLLSSLPPDLRKEVQPLAARLLERLIGQQNTHGGWSSLDTDGLCGFAHGAAGIRYSLFRSVSAGFANIDMVQSAADAAVEFEASQFVRRNDRWKDLRNMSKGRKSLNAWCSGPIGIAMAEIGIARLGLPFDMSRIRPALTAPIPNAHHLCCGWGGLAELARVALRSGIAVPSDWLERRPSTVNEVDPTSLFRGWLGTALVEHLATGEDIGSIPLFEVKW